MSILGNNLWFFPIYVNNGDLDYYLTRPVSEKFFLSFREFAANSFVNSFMALALLIWALNRNSVSYPIENYFWFTLTFINGFVLFYFVRMLFLLPVFWSGAGRGFDELFWSLERVIERPDGIYSGVVRKVFTSVLPLILMASFPVRFLIHGFDLNLLLHIVGVTIIFALVFNFTWKRALLNYTSASS